MIFFYQKSAKTINFSSVLEISKIYLNFVLGLVNNAGIYQPPNSEEMSKRDKIKAVVDVNVYGVKRVSEAFANHIQRSPEPGRIVNVTSASGPYYVQDMCDGPMKDKLLAKDVEEKFQIKSLRIYNFWVQHWLIRLVFRIQLVQNRQKINFSSEPEILKKRFR